MTIAFHSNPMISLQSVNKGGLEIFYPNISKKMIAFINQCYKKSLNDDHIIKTLARQIFREGSAVIVSLLMVSSFDLVSNALILKI